ncbi:MAG: hypothetical protein RBU29_10740 [bacterium]|jgi:hypothetical protein|nr:hypothetical protein [bacterium]
MAKKINWAGVIAKLPGVYVEDQDPEGCGVAVSLEASAPGRWVVHAVRDENGHIRFLSTSPCGAYAVFQHLEKLFAEAGYIPELSEVEYDMLELPPKDRVFHQTLAGKMPGVYLGMPEEEGLEWAAHYSVEVKGDGRYVLYSGVIPEGGVFGSEPEIDPSGVYDLSQVLDELRLLGFAPTCLDFLYRFDTLDLSVVERNLPGSVISCPSAAEQGLVVSVCWESEDRWKVFTAERAERETRIHEQRDLDARQVHHRVYELVAQPIPAAAGERVGLPPLEKVFSESISKKLKGFFLGQVQGRDEGGHVQTRFVSLQHEGKDGWSLYYVKSEELLAGGRKLLAHHAGPFGEERIYPFLESLDPLLDPLDLHARLSGQKNPDLFALAKRFEEQMEAN